MKIGLITVNFADYGSYYHAAALYKKFEELGYECEFVNECLRYKKSKKLMMSDFVCRTFPGFVKFAVSNRVTAFRTYNILKNDLKLFETSPRFESFSEISDRYDAVVIGSDELWSCTNPNMLFIPEYYGEGISSPHISYATSGITLKNPTDEQVQLIKRGLSTFSSLGVRDEITKTWVKELTGLDSCVVLDPTLLNPYFRIESPKKQDYIAVYGEHFAEEHKKAISTYANENDLQLLAIAWKHDWCDTFLDAKCAEDVQTAFANARYAMSSTFHGTIFSIVQHTDFTSFTSELRGEKVKALLSQLGLSDRLYIDDINKEPVDFEKVEETLSGLRTKSEEYLDRSLKEIKNAL